MNAVKYMVGIVAALSLGGCAANTGSSTEPTEAVTGTTSSEQAITVADCQTQVASCVKSAKSFLDLGGCTTKFQSCTTQAAADLVGQSNLLKTCRAKSDACLAAAVTLGDIKACRGL